MRLKQVSVQRQGRLQRPLLIAVIYTFDYMLSCFPGAYLRPRTWPKSLLECTSNAGFMLCAVSLCNHQPHARQERDAAAASEGGLVTFRQQMGFGIHVLVMMGTFYALGHYAAAHVSRSAAHVRTPMRTMCKMYHHKSAPAASSSAVCPCKRA